MLVRGWNLRGIMGITGGGEEGDEYGWWVNWVFFIIFQIVLTGCVGCLTLGFKGKTGYGLWWWIRLRVVGFIGLSGF